MPEQGVCFLERCARRDADAAYELARCYNEGIGTEKDTEKAENWFRLASDLGHTGAQEVTVCCTLLSHSSSLLHRTLQRVLLSCILPSHLNCWVATLRRRHHRRTGTGGLPLALDATCLMEATRLVEASIRQLLA